MKQEMHRPVCLQWAMERTITGDFHEKKVVLEGKWLTFDMKDVGKDQALISDFHEKPYSIKVILQFAQKIDIIKKTIAHKV